MKKLAFSVVVPVYNAASSLMESLHSIENQTYKPAELIIVNDGSTDASAALIEAFIEKTALKVVYLVQENKGLGAARNCGWQKAKSEWIAFLDADDLWFENKLSELNNRIAKDSKSIYYHSMQALEGGRDRNAAEVNRIEDLLLEGKSPIPSSVVIAKAILQKHSGFIEDKAFLGVEDLHLWLRLIQAKETFIPIEMPLGKYRAGGMSSKLEAHSKRVEAVLDTLANSLKISLLLYRQSKRRLKYERARAYHKEGGFRQAMSLYMQTMPNAKSLVFCFACFLRIRI